MKRRRVLATVAALAGTTGGCAFAGTSTEDDDEEVVTVEVRVSQFGTTEYGGSVAATVADTGETVLSESFTYALRTDTPDDEGVSSGIASGGGFFYADVARGTTLDVAVTLDSGASESYAWTVEDALGLAVRTTPDSIEFSEGEKTYPDDPTN